MLKRRNSPGLKMLIMFIFLMSFILGGCASGSLALFHKSQKPFTIIALPDTQYEARYHPALFKIQTKWIAQNKNRLNIMCVVHEGDITDKNTVKEWKVADASIRTLDEANIPVCVNEGNHDLPGAGKKRDATRFNKFFPVSRYSNQPWFGGVMPGGGLENAYYFFKRNSQKYMILCIEFGPRDKVLRWANRVVSAHKDCKVIVTTHCYMYFDDTRVGAGDKWNPHNYGVRGNDGEDMWEKFVKRHKNIFLVLCGHILGDGKGLLVSTGDKGNKVIQILANYQMKTNGGNAWLRIMTFHPVDKTIDIKTYSPFLEKYDHDPSNEFKISYE